ncbi:dynein light chain Tctex-type [Micractinium conductrix]|uniref:Dynein light chain Tctex-type n=1 Tax=Micractinium conductrix TaxID=554055 RepID=A0A2P6VR86_9CHLO|nr:dynein light chain Tctex-type [Micractinium conductrix]|eukprot:PSC76609.1 dynein light chain Tctex-type [Micractinium conductrix]
MAAALAAGASATALPPPPLDAALALAEFEAGLDGLAENDLVDEAEVDSIIRETVLHAIGDMPWSDAKVGPWTSQVIEGILKKLAGLQKPMKYVCHVSLTQRAGAGLHAAAASRCNAKTDGSLTVHWESATVLALVTVFWLAA